MGDEEEKKRDPLTEHWADFNVAKEEWRQEEVERKRKIRDCAPAHTVVDADELPAWADFADEWRGWDKPVEVHLLAWRPALLHSAPRVAVAVVVAVRVAAIVNYLVLV